VVEMEWYPDHYPGTWVFLLPGCCPLNGVIMTAELYFTTQREFNVNLHADCKYDCVTHAD